MVQVGNEIRTGMLWPDGRLGTPPNEHGSDFDRLAELLKAGIRGVHDARQEADPDGTKGLPPVRIALHLDNGGDNALHRWWFDEIVKRDVPFDVIGLSYYPYWHGTLPELKRNMNDISQRYDKDVVVLETAYAFTLEDADGYPNIIGPEQRASLGILSPCRGKRPSCATSWRPWPRCPAAGGSGSFTGSRLGWVSRAPGGPRARATRGRTRRCLTSTEKRWSR